MEPRTFFCFHIDLIVCASHHEEAEKMLADAVKKAVLASQDVDTDLFEEEG